MQNCDHRRRQKITLCAWWPADAETRDRVVDELVLLQARKPHRSTPDTGQGCTLARRRASQSTWLLLQKALSLETEATQGAICMILDVNIASIVYFPSGSMSDVCAKAQARHGSITT